MKIVKLKEDLVDFSKISSQEIIVQFKMLLFENQSFSQFFKFLDELGLIYFHKNHSIRYKRNFVHIPTYEKLLSI